MIIHADVSVLGRAPIGAGEECVRAARKCLIEAFSLDDDAHRFYEHTHLGSSGELQGMILDASPTYLLNGIGGNHLPVMRKIPVKPVMP